LIIFLTSSGTPQIFFQYQSIADSSKNGHGKTRTAQTFPETIGTESSWSSLCMAE